MERPRILKSSTPIYFAAISERGGLEIPAYSCDYIDFDEEILNIGFLKKGTQIYLNRDMYGLYRIVVEVTSSWSSTDGGGESDIYIFKNGSGFNTRASSSGRCSMHLPESYNTATTFYITDLKKDDYIQVLVCAYDYDLSIYDQDARILIEYISSYGYNNGFGGRIHYRGVIR